MMVSILASGHDQIKLMAKPTAVDLNYLVLKWKCTSPNYLVKLLCMLNIICQERTIKNLEFFYLLYFIRDFLFFSDKQKVRQRLLTRFIFFHLCFIWSIVTVVPFELKRCTQSKPRWLKSKSFRGSVNMGKIKKTFRLADVCLLVY